MPKKNQEPLTLMFDPKVIEHLGVKMYSTLPPVLSELVANAYDADAGKVSIELYNDSRGKKKIVVKDDGIGMTRNGLQENFLVIGRNRRESDSNKTPKGRWPIGKKGLGKLSFFGIVKTIAVETVKDKELNKFTMKWDDIMSSKGAYKVNDLSTKRTTHGNGTTITLTDMRRKSPFNAEDMAKSLARYFLFDTDFIVSISVDGEKAVEVNHELKFEGIEKEFTWKVPDEVEDKKLRKYFKEKKISGEIITAKSPIKPKFNMRGITLFSRTKLVQDPYFFSESTSSHFYSYLTGSLQVDFIDDLPEEVISTNRLSLNWEHPDTEKLHENVQLFLKKVTGKWREKRKENKTKKISTKLNMNIKDWFKKLEKQEVKEKVMSIVHIVSDDDSNDLKKIEAITKLYNLIPPYPYLHWRFLHPKIREVTEEDYIKVDYIRAAVEAVKCYVNMVKTISGNDEDGNILMEQVFGKKDDGEYRLHLTDRSNQSMKNVEDGQLLLSKGVVTGFRNPASHELRKNLTRFFGDKECLDILGLISYLLTQTEKAKENKKKSHNMRKRKQS